MVYYQENKLNYLIFRLLEKQRINLSVDFDEMDVVKMHTYAVAVHLKNSTANLKHKE